MSFSSNVREELCRAPLPNRSAAVAECLGVALYCNAFRADLFRIVTENADFAARLPKLLKKAFNFSFDRLPEEEKGKLQFQITDPAKLGAMMEAFGFSSGGEVMLHVNYNVLEDEAGAAAFLRGAFLAGGSVTDPGKRYHLELSTAHAKVSGETHALMHELNLSPKEMERTGNYVLYFKQSDYIEDFLTIIGAPVCAMQIMEAKVEKGLINNVNRRVNCETANLEKVVDAAQDQIAAIRLLRRRKVLETLPEKLQETARLREENPEANLSELAEMSVPPVSKSAINHRLRKLVALSKE